MFETKKPHRNIPIINLQENAILIHLKLYLPNSCLTMTSISVLFQALMSNNTIY